MKSAITAQSSSLNPQELPNHCEVEPVDANEFLPGEIAAENGDGAARETEFVGAEFAERGSGAALDGRGVGFDLRGTGEQADQLATGGVRDRFDRECARGWRK